MLFTDHDNENLSKDSWKYLALRCQIELKKLHRQLANKDKMELREAARMKQSEGTTIAALATNPADQARAADHGDDAIMVTMVTNTITIMVTMVTNTIMITMRE